MPTWHPHPDVWLLFGSIVAGYLIACRRHEEATGEATPRRKRRLFLLGMGVLWLGADYPIHDLAENYLYLMHMVQHMLFTLVAAPILIAGMPAWLLRDLLRPRLVRTRLAVPHPARRGAGLLQRRAAVHALAGRGRGLGGLRAAALLPARADRVLGARDVVARDVAAPRDAVAAGAGTDALPVLPVAGPDDPGVVPHVRAPPAVPDLRDLPSDLGRERARATSSPRG